MSGRFKDTMELDPVIVEELSSLYDREEQREPVKLEPVEEAKEIVGKSTEESGE